MLTISDPDTQSPFLLQQTHFNLFSKKWTDQFILPLKNISGWVYTSSLINSEHRRSLCHQLTLL